MKLRTLIKRSLRFHWRSHLGVVIGAAIGSAALIGALIVGDSVKGSLRERALERMGNTQFALFAHDRLFRDQLGSEVDAGMKVFGRKSGGRVSAALALPATAANADGSARALNVQLLGIDRSFDSIAGSERFGQLNTNEVLLNQALADQLRASPGDFVLFRATKPSALSGEATISSRNENALALRLQVGGIVGANELGNFHLRPAASPPMNAFVPLAVIQSASGEIGRANLLLAESCLVPEHRVATGVDRLHDFFQREFFRKPSRVHKGKRGTNEVWFTPTDRLVSISSSIFLHSLSPLRRTWNLSDAQADWAQRPEQSAIELHTHRVFLDAPLVRSALAADTNAQPLLTYLANLITVGSNAAPYSMVTAAGAPWTPSGLRDDEIVLNQWLAEDLQAKPGDEVTLVYYDPESGARLTERTNTFRVHSIVPMQMPWADRTLMPQFPGIEKAETTADWDTAFPLVHKIRPQDDDYWTEHRGTPKAFVTLAAGQQMWANRFGNLTAIRFPVPTNLVAAEVTRLHSGSEPTPTPSKEGSPQPDAPTNADPLLGGVRGGLPGKSETPHVVTDPEQFRAVLEKKILATLKPEELGLRFEPVREQALKAAEQSQDFGELFIGFSLFVIVAALLLMAMLFQFSLEQRAAEIGTLLALGFTPKQVRGLFLREGAALAFLGGILGTLGGIGYARVMLHGLTTLWSEAVGGSALKFFVTPQTLAIGLLASTVVAVFTLWLALCKQARQPARVLLAGALECGDSSPLFKNPAQANGVPDTAAQPMVNSSGWFSWWREFLVKRGQVRALQSGLLLAAALGLIVWTLVKGDTANAGAFFGAGALVLIAGLSFLSTRLSSRSQPSSILHPPSSQTLARRGLTRRRSRSVATVAMLASGTFLIVSIGVFRLDANRDATQRTSGTGGFALIGESTMPVVADLNTKVGRESFALNEADFADVNFVQFRVRAGDEASCLNLNRAQKPRLLGVNPAAHEGRFTSAKGAAWPSLRSSRRQEAPSEESAINQSLLTSAATNEIPAIGDAASIQWAMGKQVGDTLDYVDERGQPFKVRIVGAVANSILQGQLIIDEAEFVKRFPGESGYKYFLIDAPTNRITDVSAKLSRALQDTGLELTPAPQRLAQFNAVQNTYLGTFQILGGLGLLLGSAGLGIVVLRNVLERRGELAVLLAVGWRRQAVQRLVLTEHSMLLGLGLALGLAAAAIAVLPSVLTPGAEFPWLTLSLTLAAVLGNGLLWTWLAARLALRGDLLAALRND